MIPDTGEPVESAIVMGIAVQIRATPSPLPKEGMTLQTPFFQEKHLTPRRAPLRIGPYARHQPDSEIGHLVPAERRPRFSTLCHLFLRIARRSMAFDAPLDFEEATSSLSIALQRLGRLREASCRQQGQGNEGNGCTPKSDGHPPPAAPQRTISAPLSHVNNSDIVSWDLAVDRSPGS